MIKREALAIEWAVEEFSNYLERWHFMLVMDHASQQWMAKAKYNPPNNSMFSPHTGLLVLHDSQGRRTKTGTQMPSHDTSRDELQAGWCAVMAGHSVQALLTHTPHTV